MLYNAKEANLNKYVTFICLMLCSAFGWTNQGELVLSRNISISYQQPQVISHSGNLLIMRYEDWYFSHEVVDPKAFYKTVDLSGLEHTFIKSIFLDKERKALPLWLGELAREQADIFGVAKKNITIKESKNFSLLGAYQEEAAEGNIFILEDHQIHYINLSGSHAAYNTIFSAIAERGNETDNR